MSAYRNAARTSEVTGVSERAIRQAAEHGSALVSNAAHPGVAATNLVASEQGLGSIDRDKLNVNGGSLAAGHPFAATGGRIKRLQKWLDKEPFMLTYGDGIGQVDLNQLRKAHEDGGHIGTVTGVAEPPQATTRVVASPVMSSRRSRATRRRAPRPADIFWKSRSWFTSLSSRLEL